MSQYREPTLREAIETVARQAIRISRLETDNATLRAQLSAAKQKRSIEQVTTPRAGSQHPHPRDVGLAAGAEESEVSLHHSEELSHRYADLEARYASLKRKHEGCGPKIEEAHKKWREAKQSINAWKQYLERKGQYSRTGQQKNTGQQLPTQKDTSPLAGQSGIGNDTDNLRALTFSSDVAEPTDHPRTELAWTVSGDPPSSPPACSHRPRTPHVSSSQITVEDIRERDVQPCEADFNLSSGDLPVVVSSRSLKRKAADSARSEPPRQRIKQEPVSPHAPIELTSEDYVSPPRMTMDRSIRTEQSDLDTVGPPVITPRRYTHLNTAHLRPASMEPVRPVPKLTRRISSLSEGAAQTMGTELACPGWITDTHRQQAFNIPQISALNASSAAREAVALPQPISVKAPTLARSIEQPQNTKAGSRCTSARDTEIELLSEGGDQRSSQLNPASKQDHAHSERVMPSVNADRRLHDMLNGSSHERTPVFSRRLVNSGATARKDQRPPQHLPTPVSEVKRSSPAKRRSPLKRPQLPKRKESPPPVRPEEESLRIRPRGTLRLDDFRINPGYLGTDFAFADTLRGRDARRGLHTCTRLDCCGGALKKAIVMGGTSLSGKTDSEALEVYLGANWADHIETYGASQRESVVQQAHVHCFSNQHGKHRHAFARRNTPPGFWDTDFPTTQEAAKYREQALEMERGEVEERWREALREGGRWIFRDE